MTDQAPHTSLQKLTAFSLGQLIGDDADGVERHVSECDLCCQTLLSLSSTDDTFVQLLQDAKHEPRETHAVGATRVRDGVEAAEIPPALADHPRYDVIELLGVGGMGNVYRAQHRMMERTVALKVIKREMVNNSEAVERFHREVKAAAKLSHVNIVAAHDAEQAGDVHFLVMEYVEGTDLAKVVQTRGALPIGEACDYVRQAARGLQHAHELGMVHRDIKPHNLMLTDEGTIKILDFGLASLTDVSTDHNGRVVERSDLTADGSIMGTPDYISPEQAANARSVDGRSDIYSLGATFYFLLAGQPPFVAGSVMEVLKSHADLEVERMTNLRDDVPPEVDDMIARMMSKDPASRFQSPSAVADALAPIVEQYREDRPILTGAQKPQPLKGVTIRSCVLVVALLLAATALGTAFYVATNQNTVAVTPGLKTKVASPREAENTDPREAENTDPREAENTDPREADHTDSREADHALPPTAIEALNDIKFVLIPAGEFTMGTPPNKKATPTERRHSVTITTPFHIGMNEVTQQEYAWVMGDNPSSFCAAGERNQIVADHDTLRFPVECVSWKDATEFCRRLSALPEAQRAGHIYRLPTEAEWELACRAGTTTIFNFGNELNGEQANVDGAHPWGTPAKGASLNRTTKAGSYDPNPIGLFDMHGNVAEWCSDWYTPGYYDTSPFTDPTGPATGSSRVVRGGAWDSGAMYARSAAREQRAPDYRDHSLGFRVVRVSKNLDADAGEAQTTKRNDG